MADQGAAGKTGGKSNKQKEGQKGKPSGAGRRKGKFGAFFGRLDAKKLRRVFHSNGFEAAKLYAEQTGQMSLLRELVAARQRHEQEVAAAYKAKLSARAKKGAATRKARKEAAAAQAVAEDFEKGTNAAIAAGE